MATERVTYRVPAGEGNIIGDILRKFATRSVCSWQPIGYKVQATAANFGISGGTMSDYLGLLEGRLVYTSRQNEAPQNTMQELTFTWNGECFVSGEFELEGLTAYQGMSLTVCLLYSRGHHDAKANYETLRNALGDAADNYFAIPSSHSKVTTFKYGVQPVDDALEDLTIEADKGIADMACQNAIRSLSELN